MYPDRETLDERRLMRFEEENYTCEDCLNEAEIIHHIDKTKHNHDFDNLKVLCRSCHAKHHKEEFRRNKKMGKYSVKEAARFLAISEHVLSKEIKEKNMSFASARRIREILEKYSVIEEIIREFAKRTGHEDTDVFMAKMRQIL